jgi:transcriptional regulator with XRE-family HTH domain
MCGIMEPYDSICQGVFMDLFGSIGKRLREERERAGMSQTEAAHIAERAGAAGATRQSQALYEKGKRVPDAAYLSAVQRAGYDVLYILTGLHSEDPAPAPALRVEQVQAGYSVEVLSKEELALLDNYRHCPPDGQAAIKTTSAALAQSGRGVKKGKVA